MPEEIHAALVRKVGLGEDGRFLGGQSGGEEEQEGRKNAFSECHGDAVSFQLNIAENAPESEGLPGKKCFIKSLTTAKSGRFRCGESM
ncbi:MAG: hypothetical protein ACK4Q5_09780 [Saprospiraceae bacterium]